MGLENFLREMPKVELHLHLEGSIRPEILLHLADQHNIELPVETESEIRDWYSFKDFNHFVTIYSTIVKVLKTPDDFALITYDLGATLARQNVRYAEITWTPSLHIRKPSLDFDTVLAAINAGRDRVHNEFGIEMRWIPDLARNFDRGEIAIQVAEWVSTPQAQAAGVVALGLGGAEVGFPPEMFADAFDIARQNGLPANPHAGETVGPASIWGALHTLHATRIGHGVRAIEDSSLVEYLVDHRIPIEVNVTSNLCLGVYPSYQEHPLKALIKAGVIVTINSDDPPMFNTTLNDEYVHAVFDCGLTVEELENAALNGVRVSYLSAEQKSLLLAEFQAEYAYLRQKYQIE